MIIKTINNSFIKNYNNKYSNNNINKRIFDKYNNNNNNNNNKITNDISLPKYEKYFFLSDNKPVQEQISKPPSPKLQQKQYNNNYNNNNYNNNNLFH